MTHDYDYVADNIKRVSEGIAGAVSRRGNVCVNDGTVRLMAVTKTVEAEKICFACEHGVTLLGENRVQEMLGKRDMYPAAAEVHFIGGLQTNKVKQVVGAVSCVHSVDSERLLQEINSRVGGFGSPGESVLDVLLEINVGGEDSKNGVSVADGTARVCELADFACSLPYVRLRGLMTIPPVCDSDGAMKYFTKTREVFETVKGCNKTLLAGGFDILSMGMSGDFEQAVLCGATIVRVGTALFGRRL
ncbi:YggS family pyridoxal phosphate enzyme [Clostridia bacterium]|nr:YggS family pyridoxal phosphate enzyme [Clostridia bacterium]